MRSRRRRALLLTAALLAAALLAAGCASGQTQEQQRVLLEELGFVRAALKQQREELQQLRQQTAALSELVQQLERLDRGRRGSRAGSGGGAGRPDLGERPQDDAGPVAAGITTVGPNHARITRAALDSQLASPSVLARSARVVPNFRNSRAFGFKLFAIRPGSLYAAVGLQNGDVLVRINGMPITTPDDALQIYTRLRAANMFVLEVHRRGKPVSLRIDIVP